MYQQSYDSRIRHFHLSDPEPAPAREAGLEITSGMKLRDVERLVILETLRQQSFNRTRAARVLGIGIRTLQRKLKQYKADEPDLQLALDA